MFWRKPVTLILFLGLRIILQLPIILTKYIVILTKFQDSFAYKTLRKDILTTFFFEIRSKILAFLGQNMAILWDKNPYLEVELESRLSRSPSSFSSVQEND